MKKLFALVPALLFCALVLSACSGDDSGDDGALPGDVDQTPTPASGPDETAPPPELQEQPQPPQEIVAEVTTPVDGVVEIVASDAAFANNNVQMPVGEPVTIRVTNSDPVIHNLRIAGLDGQFETEDDAVTDPQSIPANGTGELTFAPPVTGAYTFRCDFHPDTMGGRIVVE